MFFSLNFTSIKDFLFSYDFGTRPTNFAVAKCCSDFQDWMKEKGEKIGILICQKIAKGDD